MTRTISSRYLAVLAPAVWGSTYLVTTELLPPGRPMFAGLLRSLPAGLALLLLARGSLPRGTWILRALLLGTLNIGLFFALLFLAAYRLPGGIAAMVNAIQPLLVIALSAVALGTPIRLVHVGAALLGALGVTLLLSRSTSHLDPVGIAAAFGAACSMASGIVLTKKWGRPVGLLVFTGWQLIAGGLVLLVPALVLEGVPDHVTVTNVMGYAYLSLIGACLAYFLWFRGIEQLAASAASFLSLISPLVATVLGFLVLGERLTSWQLLGIVSILTAVLGGQLSTGRVPASAGVSQSPQKAPGPAQSAQSALAVDAIGRSSRSSDGNND